MKFDNPLAQTCPGCAAALSLPLNEVVSLRATCPHCAHCFRELGLAMRRYANKQTRYFVVTEVVWIFEGRHGFTADESKVNAIRTPNDLAELLRAQSGEPLSDGEVLVELAQRIRRPLDSSHLDVDIADLVPAPTSA